MRSIEDESRLDETMSWLERLLLFAVMARG